MRTVSAAFGEQAAQRPRRLIAHQRHGRVAPPELRLKVIADAPGIAHAARRHDDGAGADGIELLAFLGVDDGSAARQPGDGAGRAVKDQSYAHAQPPWRIALATAGPPPF